MRKAATIMLTGGMIAGVALTGGPAGAASTAKVTVLAKGLDAPKHLLEYGGELFYVDAGRGGPSNCVTGPGSEGTGDTKYCEARTGAVGILVDGGGQAFSGLPSVVEKDTGEVAGPAALAFSTSGDAAIAFQDVLVDKTGGNALPAPASTTFGTLEIFHKGSNTATYAPIAKFAAAHPQGPSTLGNAPGETAYDSDPYDVVSYKSGYVVADAAANSLLQVTTTGRVSLLARFPTVPETIPAGAPGNPGKKPVTIDAQAVPTSVAVGPDGALYVGLLRGAPSKPGTADIYRVVPGHTPTIFAKGLTAVTAIAFDSSGRLLATEYSTGGLLAPSTVPGALVRVSASGKTVTKLPVSGLYQPTGVAVSSSGTAFVSNRGDSTSTSAHPGQVLEITGLG
jgi:hypothetical protein